jgi:hypothetical protein
MREPVVGGAGSRIGVQGAGEVRGLDHDRGLGVEFHLDLNLIAGHDAGGLPVGVAQPEQVAAAHDGDPALP